MTEIKNEVEPFPAFIQSLSAAELTVLRHEAILARDDVTKKACDEEFRRRALYVSPA